MCPINSVYTDNMCQCNEGYSLDYIKGLYLCKNNKETDELNLGKMVTSQSFNSVKEMRKLATYTINYSGHLVNVDNCPTF